MKYTVREGLVQNQVLSMLKDSRGYVWCGTWYGLSRFNGETFENYTEAEGLWNGPINSIIEDNDGFIWICSPASGLARFDGKTFKKYNLPTNHYGSLHFNSHTNTVRLWEEEKKELWEVKGDTVVPSPTSILPRVETLYIRYHAPTDTYFYVQDQQIFTYKSGETTVLTDRGNWDVEASVYNDIHVMKRLPTGGIQRYVVRQGRLIPFLTVSSDLFSILETLPYAYVFISQESLYYLPPNSLQAERLGESAPGMPYIYFLNQKSSSILWIPTEKGLWGLMLTGFKNFKDGEVPYAWSVVEDSGGKMLFLNYWKGVQEYDGQNLRYIPQKDYLPKAVASYKPLNIIPGPDAWYYRALRDRNGYCWLPNGTGLFRYKQGHWDFIRKGKNNLAFSIAEDFKRKKIVVSGVNHFYTIDINPPFRTDSIRNQSKLFDGILLCTVVSPTGEYLFSGRGVDRYNPDTRKFTSYTFENGKLPVKGFHMLYFDWNGTLWAGGKEVLCRYNPEKDCFEKVIDFKFHQIVQMAEQISPTHLLIGDMKNLYILNLKKFNATGAVDIKTFNHHNGFMGMEPGQLGSYRDSKGQIWITSSSVLSVLDPKQLDLTTRPLRTMISKVNKQGVSFIHPEELVEVPEGESIINIKVEPLGDDKPYNSEFSYWLEGEMDGWTDWQKQPVITLNNLSNGTHTLKVRSRSGDFNAHEASIATLRFSTKVPLWKSPDFYLYAIIAGLALLAAVASLLAVGQRRKRKMIQQQNRLEERDRAMQLLQAQTIQSQMNRHFTSNTLAAIQRLALTHQGERASDNLVKMERLTRAYLDDSIFKEGEPNPFTKGILLSREIYLLKLYVELMQLQYEDRFNFMLEVPETLDTGDYKLPPFLIQPFVENAIKHGLHHRTERGLLRVAFRGLSDEVLWCRIEDDGIGRAAAHRIQEKMPKDHDSVSTELLSQRIALLNQLGYAIQFEISDLPQGTAVEIWVGYR